MMMMGVQIVGLLLELWRYGCGAVCIDVLGWEHTDVMCGVILMRISERGEGWY